MGMLVVFIGTGACRAFHHAPAAVLGRAQPEQHRDQPAAKRRDCRETKLSEEIVVVIAAAVAEVMAKPHRIVHIRGLTPEDLGWSFQGRMQHHHSHRIQRDRSVTRDAGHGRCMSPFEYLGIKASQLLRNHRLSRIGNRECGHDRDRSLLHLSGHCQALRTSAAGADRVRHHRRQHSRRRPA